MIEEEDNEADSGGQEWWGQFCSGKELNNIAHSGKLMLLFEILNQCELIGDKMYVEFVVEGFFFLFFNSKPFLQTYFLTVVVLVEYYRVFLGKNRRGNARK